MSAVSHDYLFDAIFIALFVWNAVYAWSTGSIGYGVIIAVLLWIVHSILSFSAEMFMFQANVVEGGTTFAADLLRIVFKP